MDATVRLDRRSTAPLTSVSVSSGVFWGSFGVAFTDFIATRDLSYAGAGNLLAALSVVSILVMVFAAQRVEAWSRRRSVGTASTAMAVGILLLVVLPDGWLLIGFLIAGVGQGLEDVFVNAAGQEAEVRRGRAVLQWLHGSYSFGAGAGALATGAALQAGASHRAVLLGAALVHAAAATHVVATLTELRTEIVRSEHRVSLKVLVAAPVLLVPALVLAAAYFVEGSMDVWSVLYLREELGASPMVGAWGLAAFSFAMAFGRLFAGRVLFRFGPTTTLIASGTGSLAAGSVALMVDTPAIASTALLGVGFFVAAAGPAAIGMTGRAGVDVGVAIAAISTVGYTGFVVGPPALGWLAERAGVDAAMTVIVAATIGIAIAGLLAPRAESRRRGDHAPPADPADV